MSPRRNNRRRDGEPVDEERARRGVFAMQAHSDGEWMVRVVPPDPAGKTYRCPGCDHEIRPGTQHVVAWPAEGDGTDRRHWHTGCWRARDRREPPVMRRRA